jgi:DNA-binding response OmpR family regulator
MADHNDVSTWVVLLVEDDPDNTELAKQVLSFHGAEVFTAEDGVQGLELLKMITPTIILLDLAMPRMDGWHMFEVLRVDSELAGVPIIAVSAHAMQETRDRALETGFDGYIVKPYAIRTFVQDIQACLKEFSAQRNSSTGARR